MPKEIVIAGSSNTDMVILTDHLPGPGETVLGGHFFMNPGGKGANQAVAAARLGGRVSFIVKTGDDVFGKQAREHFIAEGISADFLITDPENPSGVALITVDRHAENCIAVASGANAALSESDIYPAKNRIETAGIVLMQLEIPLNTVRYIAETAAAKGVPVVLNPAPACELPDELLNKISIITPNIKEAEMLTHIPIRDLTSAKKAAKKLSDRGIRTVIITLGKQGVLLLHEQEFSHIPAFEVKAVDTTAAGDVFNAALVVALSEGLSLSESARFACKAAAISVTRRGAQSAAPFKSELNEFPFRIAAAGSAWSVNPS